MKKVFLYILVAILLISACSTTSKKLDKVEPNISRLNNNTINVNNNNDKNKDNNKQSKDNKQITAQNKQSAKERQKAAQKQRKEAEKKKKANEKQKRKDEREKKNKEKIQDELIKKAAKEEKDRIKEERKKEKENLLQILSENQDNQEDESTIKTTPNTIPIDTLSTSLDTLTLQDVLSTNSNDNTTIVKHNLSEEDNTPEFLKKFKKKDSQKKMTTMDKVVYMMDAKQQLQNITDTTKDKPNPTLYYDSTKKENFIKRTWHKLFPKKINRDITYKNFYDEDPKNILILYPWNRSTFDKSSQMLYIMATKELGKKGYYVYSVIANMEKYKKDTTFSSQYVKIKDVKELGRQYNADAIMFITIFRFENPYWTTSTNASAHYTLISTKTLDTLFHRQLEFNYDTPIPPKEYHNNDLELDKEQVYALGVMEQMQIYAFEDFPLGPYHKKYKKDKKRFSNQSDVKYKINVRPS